MNDPIKVLMVDDEERFRETTRKILERKGFATILAENGEAALAKLDQRPDVVILDIRMPGMDGHQVLSKLLEQIPDLPVIMLTGHGDRDSADQAKALGAFDYLGKPCDIDLLSDKIREACRGRGRNGGGGEVSLAAVMIPLAAYTTIGEENSVAEAVYELKTSFVTLMATNRLMETGHRSVLVLDKQGQIKGMLTIRDLLARILPAYLSSPKPATADAIQYSPMFWKGMFTTAVRGIGTQLIGEVMSQAPASIDIRASLMEAAWCMVNQNQRRLIVTDGGRPLGVVREQDLFFEMEKSLRTDR